MALSDGSWLPLVDVLRQTGADADTPQAAAVDRARLAAAAHVERLRPDLAAGYVAGAVDADVREGGVLLAARLYARAGSPTGLASFGEFGPSAILRLDPDIERLLGLGRYAPPRVG